MARVHVVCQSVDSDRVLPRLARALRDNLGWTASPAPGPADPSRADALYLMAYFEGQRLEPWPDVPVGAYFSHREEEPPNNGKARCFDAMAKRVDLRVATCKLYAQPLGAYGLTAQIAAPLERERFVIPRRGQSARPVVGFSGYTYANHRKGEDLVNGILRSPIAGRVEFRASGRGWPVPTKRHTWAEMPGFYQGLDVLVCPSRVEGIPMPPLEALACGCRVVIPRGVGLLDELADAPGICRYTRGDLKSLLVALEAACFPPKPVDREDLRAVTAPYSIQAWCEGHLQAFETLLGGNGHAGIDESQPAEAGAVVEIAEVEPVQRGTGSKRGIYCVAFGDPARKSAARLLTSIKKHMPDIPVCLCAGSKIGPEDVLVIQPDSDIGGRRAKLKAYELSPAEWETVLYLDADTEVVAPIYRYFEWVESGWEFVICKDPHLIDTMHAFERSNNKKELEDVQRAVRTLHTLQYNGGVWAFARNPRVAAFFRRWQAEWERYAQRDQGALIRAMYADPLKVLVLGSEWNTFPKYTKGVRSAGLYHYPGDARRWEGLIPGRIDSQEAWDAVKRFEAKHQGRKQRG